MQLNSPSDEAIALSLTLGPRRDGRVAYRGRPADLGEVRGKSLFFRAGRARATQPPLSLSPTTQYPERPLRPPSVSLALD